MCTQVDCALGRNLGRQTEQVNEALRQGLIERVALVVGCQVIAVEARIGFASVDDGATTVQHQADLAGYVLLGLVDKAIKGVLQGAEPQAVINEFGPALFHAALKRSEERRVGKRDGAQG